MLSKVVIPSLVLVSAGNAIITNEGFNVTNCQGSYQDSVNFLALKCYDSNGNLAERYQRLFTRPLIKECSQVSRSSVLLPTVNPTPVSNNTAPVNSTTPVSNDTSSSNSTAGSNSTVGGNSTAVDNSTAGSNSTAGNQTVVNNSTTVVDNSTSVDNNGTSSRRLQADGVDSTVNSTSSNSTEVNTTAPVDTSSDNATTPVDNSTAPSASSPGPVDNSTAPVDNSTVSVDNSTGPVNSSSDSNSTDGGVSAADQVNCCDYYEKGAGYEFSVCDGNIGAVIRQSLIGGERDRFWASQMPDSFLGPVWTDLNNLVNNYCDQRQSANSTNSTGVATSNVNVWQQLNLPWAQWKNDIKLGFDNLWVWLARYQQYLGQLENLNNGMSAPASSSAPVSNSTEVSNSTSMSNSTSGNASVPSNSSTSTSSDSSSSSSANNVDFSGLSYGTIVTEYNTIYAGFIEWYNLFFGQDGLVSVNE